MKTSDLKYVKEWYSEYRSLLFNNDIPDVETKSEGEGVYKQVRVIYKGIR